METATETAVTGKREAAKERGRFRWSSSEKGFGYIERENGEDVFCHFSSIVGMEGYRTLEQNAVVEFDVVETARGLSAKNVVAV